MNINSASGAQLKGKVSIHTHNNLLCYSALNVTQGMMGEKLTV